MSTNEDTTACGLFIIPMPQGQFTLRPFSTLEGQVSEDEQYHYEALVEGLAYMISENPYFLVSLGSMLIERAEDEIVFEPEDELLDAVAESKIVPFNKKH